MTAPLSPREIRRLRGSLGMTQPQFAALLRAHPTTVSRWEAEGQPVEPDEWQTGIMRAIGTGCAKQPAAADVAVAFLGAGAVGFALGALLGAAIEGEKVPRIRKTGRRKR